MVIALIALLYSCGSQSSPLKVTEAPSSATEIAPQAGGTEFVINATVRMRIPAEIASNQPIRCVFAHNAYANGSDLYQPPDHQAGNQATRSRAYISQAWAQLASDLKCANMLYGVKDSAGPDGARGGQQIASDINQHLSQFAEMSEHPELVNAPLVLTGLSAAGATAFWTAYTMPDRIVAIVPYHGYASRVGVPSKIQEFIDTIMSQRSRMHEIPVLYVMAANDTDRVPGIQGINEQVRTNGGVWTSVIQPNTSHANMGDQTFITSWVKEIVEQRVKQAASLATLNEQTFVGTYTLDTLSSGSYYFADPQIFSASEYSGPLSKSIWLPSRAIADQWFDYSRSGGN